MPPKAAEAPVIDFDAPEYDSVEAAGAEALSYNLDRIVALAEDGVNHAAARRQALDDAVDSAIEATLTAVDILYVAREEQAVTQVSLLHGSWEPEAPPPPCTVDTWLRAAIPESTVPKPSYALDRFLNQQNPPASSSMRRSESKRSTQVSGVASPRNTGSPPGRTRSRTGLSATPPMTARPAKELSPDEAAAENRLREELEIRRGQLAVAAGLEAKDAAAREQLAALAKGLKGRDYAYDHQGRVVPLAGFAADVHAPELQAGAHFRVASPGDPNASPGRRGGARGGAQKKAGAKGGEAGGSTSGRKLANDFKEAAAKTQPSPLETMAPNAGVTLRGAGATKSGPRRPTGAVGMSRDEFARYAAQTAKRGAPGAAAAAPAGGAGAQSGAGAAGLSTSGGRSPPMVSIVGELEGTAGSAQGEQQQHQAAPPSLLDGLPDSPPVTLGAHARHPPAAHKPSTPDINGALVNAPDWGRAGGAGRPQVGAALPAAKPDDSMIVREVGRTMRLPRERASQATGSPPLSPAKLAAAGVPPAPTMTFVTARVK